MRRVVCALCLVCGYCIHTDTHYCTVCNCMYPVCITVVADERISNSVELWSLRVLTISIYTILNVRYSGSVSAHA